MNDTKRSVLNSEFEFHIKESSVIYNTTFLSFFLPFIMGVLLFFPLCVWTKGIFIYFGDYNSQQIPFYMLCHDAVRNGEIGWNWVTDLGVNFIGSYSFYLLGSPFFWLTIPFPSVCVPYLMAPLFILKLSFMGLASYLFFTEFVNKKMALIGSIMYAFSGYTLFNLFYNHFLEALIYLPLMLFALERRMKGKNKGLFAFLVFLSAVNNYFFFIGQAVFLIIYWLIRLPTAEDWKKDFSTISLLFFEAIVGTAMAGFILLPSFYTVSGNYRTGIKLSGWDIILYTSPKRYLDILHSFFFPQDNPVFYNFVDYEPDAWQSIAAWVPMIGCTGAIAYFFSKEKKNWLRKLIVTLLCFSLIPVLNASFQLFSQQFYARWFYIFTLMIILSTLLCIEDSIKKRQEIKWKKAFLWSGGAVAAFSLIGILPTSWNFSGDKLTYTLSAVDSWGLSVEKAKIGLERFPDKFWIYVSISAVGLILSAFLINLLIKRSKNCYKVFVSILCIYTYIVSYYIISIGQDEKARFFPTEFFTDIAIEQSYDLSIPKPDDGFYRYDFYDETNMCFMGIYWQIPSIQSFHSIVSESSIDFYNTIGVPRGVASESDKSHYPIRSLLSVKYLFDYSNENGPYYAKSSEPEYFYDEETDDFAMPGYKYISTENGFKVYENLNYIPMGYTYDYYITEDEIIELNQVNREFAMLKALAIPDDMEKEVNKTLKHIDIKKYKFTKDEFILDCKERNKVTANNFSTSSYGFKASITLEDEDYVFFSVPYEKGWTATVNGKKTEIINANFGFMAVKCPKGDSSIEFSYETPGLRNGVYISLLSIFTFLIYLLLSKTSILSKMHKKEENT